MKALAFGEVLWDVYTNSEHLGGASMNFAAHFKKCGGEAWIVTAVGDDALGKKAVSEIDALDINTEYISTVDGRETGKCLVTLDRNQIPSYKIVDDVAYDYIRVPDTCGRSFDVLYFGTLALRGENNKNTLKEIIAKNDFGNIYVDVNLRAPFYCKEVVEFACERATIIKISDEELSALMGFFCDNGLDIEESTIFLSEKFKNLKTVIITQGGKGSLIYDCNSKKYYKREAQKVEVVSTVGAGDSFSAAFLSKYIQTDDLSQALSFATKVSGYVVSCKESIPEYDIKDFN